MAKERARERR